MRLHISSRLADFMQITKSDKLWLDEYAKRSLMRNIYSASSMAFTWSLNAKIVKMLLDKSAGEEISFHRTRSPALMAGLTMTGLGLSYLLYDQMSGTDRLEAQRLAKRIGFNAQDKREDESKYAGLPSKVGWRHVLTPGGRSLMAKMQKLSPEDQNFERMWHNKYMLRSMKGDLFGSVQYGALYAFLPFALRALMAKGNGEKVIFRHPQTTIIAAALMAAGSITQYQLARLRTEIKLLDDNYQAREIARAKGDMHAGVSDMSSLFTGEKDAKNNPFHAYDKKWLQENTHARAKWFILESFTNTIFFGAIATAANILLDKAGGKEVKFRPGQSSAVFGATFALGGAGAYLASLAKAHVHKQEDDRLAVRVTGQKPDMQGNIEEPKGKPDTSDYWQKKMTQNTDEEKNPTNTSLNDDVEPPQDFEAYDKEWLKRYQSLSFSKGLYSALAGATFFGMFSIATGMLLDKVGDPKKKIDFRIPQSPLVMAGMSAVGVCFAYLSNVKESLLRKLEDDRLAHRIKAGEPEKPQASMNSDNSEAITTIASGKQPVQSSLPVPGAENKWQNHVAAEREEISERTM